MLFSLLNIKTALLIAAGGIFPALLWLWFWLKEDRRHPEPKRIILLTFVLGGASVVLAYYLEQYASAGFDPSALERAHVDWSDPWKGLMAAWPYFYLFLSWGLIEEFVKYLAALAGAFRTKYFDEPIDAMVYMITAALGFAAVENSLFLLKTLRMGLSGFDFLMNGNLRFLGATLLHIFCSAIVGGMIALAFRSRGRRRLIFSLVGVLTAALLHALFNFFIIMNSGQGIFRVLLGLWILTLLIIVLFEKIKHITIPYVQR
jgi:RsiW-degrading membrane proteinase PrsW (M82 family)